MGLLTRPTTYQKPLNKLRTTGIKVVLVEKDLESVMQVVEELTGIKKDQMVYGRRGNDKVQRARHLFHVVADRITACNHESISKYTGRERSTVSHSITVAWDLIETEACFRQKFLLAVDGVMRKFNC